MLRVGILGPTGYAGLELIDILLRHPEAEIVYLGSRREENPPISTIWPSLRGRLDMRCGSLEPKDMPGMDVAFVALPHTIAMDHVPALLDKNVAVVDISADYRLKSAEDYARYYRTEHKDPHRLADAVYGLPELFHDDIVSARLVANPGCYPTAVILAVAPLLVDGLADVASTVIADAKSGVSGAGRSPRDDLHFPEANENFRPYKVGVHQHNGEMLQTFRRLAGGDVALCFVPHLVPMDRGILATCYVKLRQTVEESVLQEKYAAFYRGAPFVRCVGNDELPSTKHVSHTNFCDVAVRVVDGRAVAMSAIDNLVKGASGQAVQNMNIAFGLDQTLGVLQPGRGYPK